MSKTLIFVAILLLIKVSSSTSSDFCVNLFTKEQQEKQSRFNLQINAQLNAIFHEEKHLFNILFTTLWRNRTLLETFQSQATRDIKSYSSVEFYAFLLLFVIMVVSALVRNFGGKFSSLAAIVLKKYAKIMAFLLLIVSIGIISFSIHGIRESPKTQKSLNHFFCQLFRGPKGFIRGSSLQQGGLEEFYTQLSKFHTIFTENHQIIYNLFANEKSVEQQLKTIRMILDELKDLSPQSKDKYQSELKDAHEFLSRLYDHIQPQSVIKNKMIQFNETIQHSSQFIYIGEIYINTLKNYEQRTGIIQRIIGNGSSIIKAAHVSIIVIGFLLLIFAGLFLKRNSQANHQFSGNSCSLLFLYAFGFIFFIFFMINALLVPGIFWISQSTKHIITNQTIFREEFNLLQIANNRIPEIISFLLPFNKNFSSLFGGSNVQILQSFQDYLQPYSQKQVNYFYDLYKRGLNLIQNKNSLAKIEAKIESPLVKKPLIPFIAKAQNAIKVIIATTDEGGKLTQINASAMGNYIKKIIDQVYLYGLNRLYTQRNLCKNQGLLLLIAFLLSFALLRINVRSKFYQKVKNHSEYRNTRQTLQMSNAV